MRKENHCRIHKMYMSIVFLLGVFIFAPKYLGAFYLPTSEGENAGRIESAYPLGQGQFKAPALASEEKTDAETAGLTPLTPEEITTYKRYQKVYGDGDNLEWPDASRGNPGMISAQVLTPLTPEEVATHNQYKQVIQIGDKFYWPASVKPPTYNPDVTGDGVVDQKDLDLVGKHFDTDINEVSQYDLNQDNKINRRDLFIAAKQLRFIAKKFGTDNTKADLNKDGKVDLADLVIATKTLSQVAKYFGTDIAKLKQMDLNQDNQIDIFDLALVGKNFGKNFNSGKEKPKETKPKLNLNLKNARQPIDFDALPIPRRVIKELKLESEKYFRAAPNAGPQDRIKLKALPTDAR